MRPGATGPGVMAFPAALPPADERQRDYVQTAGSPGDLYRLTSTVLLSSRAPTHDRLRGYNIAGP